MKKKKLMALLLSGILAFSLFGCGKAKDPETTKKESKAGGTLTVGDLECVGLFNQAYTNSSYDLYMTELVFDQLMKVDVEGKYIPSAAKSWELKDGGKEIIFKMRDDMVFSDGEKVTANDVVFTYKFLSDSSYTGVGGDYVIDLEGYEDYSTDKTKEFKSVVAVDDYTVKFIFKDAQRTNLAKCIMDIMPEHYYGKDFKPGDTSSIEALNAAPIGSGPYTLEKFEPKKFVSLKKNPKYNGEGYAIENIVYKFTESTTDLAELTSKAIDVIPGEVEPDKIEGIEGKDFLTSNHYARSGYGYVKFNCEKGPTADVKVRQALYYGFNIQEFIDSYYKGYASIQYHPFSQTSWAIDEALLKEMTEYKFDIKKAATMLDEAGWKVGASGFREKDGVPMELNLAATADNPVLDTLIPMWQRDWGEGLKIKLNIAYLEFASLLDFVQSNADENVDKWSMYFMASTFSTPDPNNIYSDFHSSQIGSGLSNSMRYRNAEIDRILDEGKTIVDIEEAKPLYKEAAKILNEECPIIPVYANTYYDLYNTKLKNFKTSSYCKWTAAIKDAYIEE